MTVDEFVAVAQGARKIIAQAYERKDAMMQLLGPLSKGDLHLIENRFVCETKEAARDLHKLQNILDLHARTHGCLIDLDRYKDFAAKGGKREDKA